jgi:hypothetical protein
VPVLADVGGWPAVRKVFGEPRLAALLRELNEDIAA